MHVADLDSASLNQGSTWTPRVFIRVVDAHGQAVSNATVSGTWTHSNGETTDCTTGSEGWCSTQSETDLHKSNSSTEFSVTSIVHGSLDYDSTKNSDPDSDSNGTTTTVTKP